MTTMNGESKPSKKDKKPQRKGSNDPTESESNRSSVNSEGSHSTTSSKKIDMQWILHDMKFLETLCNRCGMYEGFVPLLYQYFQVNDQGPELVKWATEREVRQAKDISQICNDGSTIATRLLHDHVVSDVGIKYFSYLLQPLMTSVIEYVERTQDEKLDNSQISEKTLEFLTKQIQAMLGRFEDVDKCPILLREGLLLLKKSICLKVSQGEAIEVIARVFFGVFLSSFLQNPFECKIIDKDVHKTTRKEAKKLLLVASDIVEGLVKNCIEGDSFKEKKSHLEEFIKENRPNLLDYVEQLTEEKSIKRAKVLVAASLPMLAIEQKYDAEDALKAFLEANTIEAKMESEVNNKMKMDRLLDLYHDDEGWKLKKVSKKLGISTHVRQADDSVHNYFKTTTRVQGDFDKLADLILDLPTLIGLHLKTDTTNIIKRHSEYQYDWYCLTKPIYQVAARDWTMTASHLRKENIAATLSYSIPLDIPPRPKTVRANMMLTGHIIEKDPKDPKYSTYTFIIQSDIGGSIPTWMTNSANAENSAGVKIWKKYFEEHAK